MNRLPVFGIALVLAAILSVAAPASADPFLVTSVTLTQGAWTPSLPSLPGWTGEWHGRDFDEAPLTSLGDREQAFSVFKDDFPQLNRGNQAYLSSGSSFGGGHMSGSGGLPSFSVSSRGTGGNTSSVENAASATPAAAGAPAVSQPVSHSAAGAVTAPFSVVPSFVANVSNAFSGKASSSSANAFTAKGNGNSSFAGASSVVTPEPASLLLLGSGLALAGLRRLRKRAA